jgi:hypothetical protein
MTPMIKAQAVPAIPADSFVESIGVNTHWAYRNVYTYNYTGLKAKLAESGIRYLRDGTYPETFVRAADLYNSLGIKTNMLTGRRKSDPSPQPPLDPTKIDEELNEIKTQALAATLSLEAPNEYDLTHGNETEWVETLRNYTCSLYTKVKADEMLRNLPVIGPPLVTLKAYVAVGNLDPCIDYVALHMGQVDRWPGFSGVDKNGSYSITWYLDYLARSQSPSGKRVQSTEAGYHNDITTNGVSEEAEGKYMGRVFAEYFRRGVYRSLKYELVNQGQPGREGLFGLLRNDLSEKPSFRTVKNLIVIMNDKGPDFKPDMLNYTLNGSMDNVRQMLFQKRNGDFYLMVWLEVASWNFTTKMDLYPPAQEVVLALQDNNRISNAMLYAFNNSADVNIFNLTINNNQVNFNVTDKISIIKLSNSTNSISHGVYRLTPKSALHSCLDSTGEYNHTSVIQRTYWGSFNQQWIVEPVDADYYHLINRASSRVLGLDGCNAINGNISDCQKWKFELLPDGYYRVTPKHAQDQCLSVLLCSTTDDTKVQQWSWLNTDCQHWKLNWIAPPM